METNIERWSALKPYASDSQKHIIECLENGKTYREISKLKGVTRSAIDRALQRLRIRAARQGFAPESGIDRPSPAGFNMKFATQLKRFPKDDPEGRIMEYVRYEPGAQTFEELLNDLHENLKDKTPVAEAVPPPKTKDADCMTVYPLGDPHFGMLAWREECGADFDTDIARQNLLTASKALMRGRSTKKALVLNLGDMFHADNFESMTTSRNHVVDTDTRWSKVSA